MRYRWCAALGLVTVIAGCSPTPGAPDTPGVSSAQAPETDRATLLQLTRQVDRCALFGDTQSVSGQALTVLGPTSLPSCAARIGDATSSTRASISLNLRTPGPVKEESFVKHRTIDGIDVSSVSFWDLPNSPPREQVVSGSCSYTANYPGDLVLMVQVSSSPAVDGCSLGDQLVRTAIAQYATRPQIGSTPFPTTILTGADPCAVLPKLQATHKIEPNLSETRVSSCFFTMDGHPIDVSLDYQDPELMTVSADRFDLEGHAVGGEDGIYSLVVGPPFRGGNKTQSRK